MAVLPSRPPSSRSETVGKLTDAMAIDTRTVFVTNKRVIFEDSRTLLRSTPSVPRPQPGGPA